MNFPPRDTADIKLRSYQATFVGQLKATRPNKLMHLNYFANFRPLSVGTYIQPLLNGWPPLVNGVIQGGPGPKEE